MECASKYLYEAFKDEILKELGPLDPNWFAVLTAQVSAKGNGSDQEDLCANQEGYFKAPLDRTVTESQLFSTPKVFRHNRVVSPETEDEQTFTAEQGKLPWTPTQSPYWMSKQRAPDDKHRGAQTQNKNSFDPLHTPHRSSVGYAQHISESLGAQVDSDISWTSSFNTPPPPLPPTLILSKTEESPCPKSLSTEKDIVLVRTLFPTLSKGSKVGETQPKDDDMPLAHTAVSPEAHKSPQTPLNKSEDGWQQKLPDAIEDGELRTTVASVLDGAENVLSIFFANSSSALRKVKPDRIKRRQIIHTKDRRHSSADISATNTASSSKTKTADQEPGKCPSSTPEKAGDAAASQWSPLSLSELQSCAVDSNVLTKQEKNCDSESNNLIRPHVKITDSGFIRKKRKFCYIVGKSQDQEQDTQSQKMDSSKGPIHPGQGVRVTKLLEAVEEADCSSIRKKASEKQEEHPTGDILPPSVQEKVQDLDMSQLCRDFAQDFSQMPECGKLSKSIEDTQTFFSPSVCLSAMKQAKQKARQENLIHDCEGVSNRGHVSFTNPNYSINEGTIGDSGFQSAVTDTALTTSIYQVDNYQTTLSITERNEKTHLDAGVETNLPCGQKIQTVHMKSTSIKPPGCDRLGQNGQIHSSLPEKTTVSSVKCENHLTFSNQQTTGVHTTKSNTVKQKSSSSAGEASCQLTASQKADVTELCTLLEEADSQFEFTQNKHVKQQLVITSPQTADRDIDPDFLTGIDFDDSFSSDAEKHMAKTLTLDNMTSLSDDKRNTTPSDNTRKSTYVSFSSEMIKENASAGGDVSATTHTSEVGHCRMSTEPERQHRTENSEKMKTETKNPLTLGVAFRTAGGNALRVSENCLSKARALFADLEENLTDQKLHDNQNHDTEVKTEQKCLLDLDKDNKASPYTLSKDCHKGEKVQGGTNMKDSVGSSEQIKNNRSKDATKSFKNSRMDVAMCQSGFHMASGKGISISAKSMQQAEDFFKDCDNISGKHQRIIQAVDDKKPSKPNVNGLVTHPEYVEMNSIGSKGTLALNNAASLYGNTFSTSKPFSSLLGTASDGIDSSGNDELRSADGFCTANGKKVTVSVGAMKTAEYVFDEIHTPDNSNKQQNLQEDSQFLPPVNAALSKTKSLLSECDDIVDKTTVKPSHFKSPDPGPPTRSCGFQTASRKEMAISTEALQKAKTLLSECEGVKDEISDKQSHFKSPGPGSLPREGGFQTANEKRVVISSAALKKAKTLLSECEETKVKISVNPSHLKIPNAGPSSRTGGFQTASGKGVRISPAALKKAKTLLSECDEMEDKINVTLLDSGPTHQNDGFVAASGKPVFLPAEALQKAKALFSDIDQITHDSHIRKIGKEQNNHKIHCVFTTAGGAKASEKISLKAKTLLKECDDSAKEMQEVEAFFLSTDCDMEDVKPVEKMAPQNSGFQTASGRRVTISSAALKKAKSLLSECDEADNKMSVKPSNYKSLAPDPPPRSCGFQTANGKGVDISTEALKKAKALLGECEGVEDEISLTSSNLNIPAQVPPPKSDGFQTANGKRASAPQKGKTLLSQYDDKEKKVSIMSPGSGPSSKFISASVKPVDLSPEVFQKTKASFSDSLESSSVSHTGSSDKINCGFTTAGGAKVHVSEKSLEKAKHLFKDSVTTKEMQEVEVFFKDCGIDDGILRNSTSKGPVKSSSEKNSGCMSDERRMVNVHDEPEDKSLENKNKQETQSGNFPPQNSGFQTANGKEVVISSAALSKAKSLLSECDNMVDKTTVKPSHLKSPDPGPPPRSCGFQTANRKEVTISSEALQKAKTLLSKCEGVKDEISVKQSHFKSPDPVLLPRKGGFQTANEKRVVISSAALKKAKTLLSECDNMEDKVNVTTPDSGPSLRNSGFIAASGKHVELSSDALQKAQVIFSDIGLTTDIPANATMGKRVNPHEHTEKVHGGFTTAGGAKVHVSEKSLMKAKHLLKDLSDIESHNLDQIKVNEKERTTSDDEDITANGSTCLQKVVSENLGSVRDEEVEKTFSSGAKSLHDSHGHEGNQTRNNKEAEVVRTDESSVLNFHSLNLTCCTETQQWFLAQEALDCTKALLEDEAGQSLPMTLENIPLQESPKSTNTPLEEGKGRGKRSGEDTDMNGQPPLKRRLLERFDRTVDGFRRSLEPVKICPNGVMKDRSVFKYSATLHPNITKPHRDGSTFVETRLQKTTLTQCSNPGDNSPENSFVPPFIKNTKAEKNTVFKNNIRTPSVFVPPFKKQKTIVQESSSKPQEEEDKHYHPSVMPLNSNAYVPPTKKIQGADVTLDDTSRDNTVNTESLPAVSDAEVSHVEDTFSPNQDLYLENVELARDMQDMRIRKKKRQTIRPLPGSLFLTKTSGVARIPLKSVVNGKPPARHTQKQLYEYGVHKHVSEINSETAESFRFSLLQFIKRETFTDGGGIQLADGGWLIPSNDGTAGKEEFYRALCDTPGVDPKLISEAWVYNHYRWIVWKQASMEKSFPETMGSLCLTPEQVLRQLKYRYDIEVDNSRRPALRKIMEKDDTSAKTLVLCVCAVVSEGHCPTRWSVTKTPQAADAKVESGCAVIWLTDGWYAIKAQLDEPLTAMLHKGRLAVGGKLIIHGAQLVGSQDACSPLEAPESLMLKICANSSRPARWDAKLGFHRDPRPFLLPVSSLYSNGGPVGCVDIVILRSYPIQWMERKPDGGVVFRSIRAEEKEARRYNSHKQKAMETLFAKIQAEFEKEKGNVKSQRRRRTMSHQDISRLQDGEELYEAVGDDPAYTQVLLTEQQLETLHAYRRFLMEKDQAELQDRYRRAVEAEDEMTCPKRDVTPVWRLCVSDCMNQHCSVYQLNLWRPSSDLQALLKEGRRYKVYNLTTSDGKKHSGIESVQLTGTKKTQFQELQASKEWLSACFQPRISTNFKDLQNPEFQPLCGEVDLSGYVVSIINGQGSSPAFYLADGDMNFVKVRCFSSLSQSGLEDVVKPQVLLALSNLQLRGQSMFPTPVVYAGDLTVFSTNTKEVHLQEALTRLKNLIQGYQNFLSAAEEKLSHVVKSDDPSSISSPALQSKTSICTTERSVSSQKPVENLGFLTPAGKNAPAATSSTEKDPRSLKRRRALAYLSRIPSPPRLSSLGSLTSPSVKKTFNPPRRSGTPCTLKTVHTPAPKPSDSPGEDEWVNDEELAMIDTQALHDSDSL